MQCGLAGRRLEFAWDRVVSAQNTLLQQIERLRDNPTLSATEELAQNSFDAFHCQRGLLQLKMSFLDKLPYLVARLLHPGVAGRALAEMDAQVAGGVVPHRISQHFLGVGGPLREQVAEVARGGEPGTRLLRELAPIRWGLLSEAAAEGEHRVLAHERQRGHGTRHGHAVSTLRLGHNRDLVVEARRDLDKRRVFEHCWRCWKLVADPPSAASGSRRRFFVPSSAVLPAPSVCDLRPRRGGLGTGGRAAFGAGCAGERL